MFDSLLIANRGEIARRIIRTAKQMGIRTVAVYSDVDATLPYVEDADQAVALTGGRSGRAYLDAEELLDVAHATGAQAVHPGYGFLAENADFAKAVTAAGLTWVGPHADAILAMGNKINARNIMRDAGVPVAGGTAEPVRDLAAAEAQADQIGYPIMVKAAAGGGGIGMSLARDPDELRRAYETATTRAERFFGSPDILLERFIEAARHVEIQILGAPDGSVVVLGERDCSLQRRRQKIAEETPSPGLTPALRARMIEGARRAAAAIEYRNAGTVECLVDMATEEYVFLEMNTRLQVEHPITELTTSVDLVEQQLLVAAGQAPSCGLDPYVDASGHAIELRVCAEDPRTFLPSPGTITSWKEPAGEHIRVDAGYRTGSTVSLHYDSLLAKLCVWGEDRAAAIARGRDAVAGFTVEGVKTNLPFLADLLRSPNFVSGRYDTGFVESGSVHE
ncbi:acetyl-CoA carboxylase biotin carboxylase subunit [Nocardia australiensis]|uniref:acetyl-CoA carboxylase biotin carboxylase subunit n=1 Tax=Nocardia australiensis TaxID=2887191 RepID=UPI001D15313B|nr:biotin carboxylase N-terminal domain-containing protein [Nocardia australiensis]